MKKLQENLNNFYRVAAAVVFGLSASLAYAGVARESIEAETSSSLYDIASIVYNLASGPIALITVFCFFLFISTKLGGTTIANVLLSLLGVVAFEAFVPDMLYRMFGGGAASVAAAVT